MRMLGGALVTNLCACGACLAAWVLTRHWATLLAFCLSLFAAILVRALGARLRGAEDAIRNCASDKDELLSAQRHAFGNRLQVILGLIQLGRSDQAQGYIKQLDLKSLSRKTEETVSDGQE